MINSNPNNDQYALGYTNPGATGLDKQNIVNNTLSNLSLNNSINTQGALAAQAQMPVRQTVPNTQSNNFIPQESEPSQAQIQPQPQVQIQPHEVGTDENGKPTLDGKPWIPEETPEEVQSGSATKIDKGDVHTAPFKGKDTPYGQEIDKPKKRSGIDVFNKYTDYIEGRSEGDDLLKKFSRTGLRDGLKLPWTTGEQGLMIDVDPKDVFPDDSYIDRHLKGTLKYAEEKGISPDKALHDMRSLPQAAQSNGNPDADILYYELTGNSLGLASKAFIKEAELLNYKVKAGELTEEQAQQELENFKKNISKDPQFEQRWFGNDRGSRQVLGDLIGQGVGAGLGYAAGKIFSSNAGRALRQKALKAAENAFVKIIEKNPDNVYSALKKSGLINDAADAFQAPVKIATWERLAKNSAKSGYYDEITNTFTDLTTKAEAIRTVRQLEKEIKAKYPGISDEKVATALYEYAFNKNPNGDLAYQIRDAFRGTNLPDEGINALNKVMDYDITNPEYTKMIDDILDKYTIDFESKEVGDIAELIKILGANETNMFEKYWTISPKYEAWLKSPNNAPKPPKYTTYHWEGAGKGGSYYPSKEIYDKAMAEYNRWTDYVDNIGSYTKLAKEYENDIFNDIGILESDISQPRGAEIITKEALDNPEVLIDPEKPGATITRFIKHTLKNKAGFSEQKDKPKNPEPKDKKPTNGGTTDGGTTITGGTTGTAGGVATGGALLGGALGDYIQNNLGNNTDKPEEVSAPEGVSENPIGLNSIAGGDSSYIPYRGPKLEEPLTWEGQEKYREVYDTLKGDIQTAEKKGQITPEEADALEKRATMYNSLFRSIQNAPLNDVPALIDKVEKVQGKVNDYSNKGMPKTWIGAYFSGEFGDPKSADAKRTLAYFALNSLGTALMNSAAIIQKRAPEANEWNKAQGVRLNQAYTRYDKAKTKAFENNLDSIAKAMNMSLDQKNKVSDLMNEGDIKLLYDKLGDTRKIQLLEKVARFAPYYNKLTDKQKAVMAAIMIDSGLSPRDELGLLSTNFSKREIAELLGGLKNAEYLNRMYNSHVTQKQVELVGAQLQQVLQSARLTEAEANLYSIKVYAELADKGVDAALNLVKSLLPGGSN